MCSASRYVDPGAGSIANARFTESGTNPDTPAAPDNIAATLRNSRLDVDIRLFSHKERYGRATQAHNSINRQPIHSARPNICWREQTNHNSTFGQSIKLTRLHHNPTLQCRLYKRLACNMSRNP